MHVDVQKPAVASEFKKRQHSFCSEGRKQRLLEQPEVFVARKDQDHK